MKHNNNHNNIKKQNSKILFGSILCMIEWQLEQTWRFCWAGLKGTGLLGDRLGQWVTSSDQLSALVALHIPHTDSYPTSLSALLKIHHRNPKEEDICSENYFQNIDDK